MKMYRCNVLNEFDLFLFGDEAAINRIDYYIDNHKSIVDIAGLINRLIYEKIKVYPVGNTLYGKLYVHILKRRLKNSDILLTYNDYANLMFLSNPEKMQQLLGFTDEEVILYKEELGKIYHVNNE